MKVLRGGGGRRAGRQRSGAPRCRSHRFAGAGGHRRAGYLTYVHWLDKPVACAGFGSCRAVADSGYAWIGGVPVAFLGLLGYIALFAISVFWMGVGNRYDVRPLLAIWGMSLAGPPTRST